ncbi:hypothetical protein AB1Y20_015668 [Prymnesium parvum]|uniref:SAM-dependent methyltransferase n=1 Tax=Prymnesium parvum TaxID=97485 RepID=A0AB34JXF1_PRYPA
MLEQLEQSCEMSIMAARRGRLTEERARRLLNGDLLRHVAPHLPEAHVSKGVAMSRHLFTRRASWAVFTTEWMDSLARRISALLPGVASPRVLEVCAGLNTLAAPMRSRGLDWISSDIKVDPDAVCPPLCCDAASAVASVGPALVFWAWWSQGSSDDAQVAKLCCEQGIPIVFVGEARGGITGSVQLWDGPWAITPLADFSLCCDEPFHDVPCWPGFSDRTWLLTANSETR